MLNNNMLQRVICLLLLILMFNCVSANESPTDPGLPAHQEPCLIQNSLTMSGTASSDCVCPASADEEILESDCGGHANKAACDVYKCKVKGTICAADGTGEYCGCLGTRSDGSTIFFTPEKITEVGCDTPPGFGVKHYKKAGMEDVRPCENYVPPQLASPVVFPELF